MRNEGQMVRSSLQVLKGIWITFNTCEVLVIILYRVSRVSNYHLFFNESRKARNASLEIRATF